MMEILKNWQPMNDECFVRLQENHKALTYVEFFNSKIRCASDGMYYKIIDGTVLIVKPSAIMGNYALILYASPIGLKNPAVLEEMKNAGIQLRGARFHGTDDPHGFEYVYSCADFLNMEGSEYRKHRNFFKHVDLSKLAIQHGDNKDLREIITKWETKRKAKHQTHLYSLVLKFKQYAEIRTTYYKGLPVGFSIIEPINDYFGIILQRLINPDYPPELAEPNFILHLLDCKAHPEMILNIGGYGNNIGMKLAKEKLVPLIRQPIQREKANIKTTKLHYETFKGRATDENS